MLLLRAFYDAFEDTMRDENSINTKHEIAKCLWKTDAFGRPLTPFQLKIDSEIATDNDKEEFVRILQEGNAPKDLKSRYAVNYRFFQDRIHDFITETPSYFPYLPIRILVKCILLPIKAESQDTALRIFSTLNDRGKPLSDSDIFKAHLYKDYTVEALRKFYEADGYKILIENYEVTFSNLISLANF